MTKFLLVLAGLAITLAGCGGMTHDMSNMPGHGDTGMDHSSMSGAGALSSVMDGYRFAPASTTLVPSSAQKFTFQILNPDGRPQTQFAVDQTKQLHMYVVRRDLTGFQHLHPELAPDGTWSIQLTVADPGTYRAIVDFIAIDAKAAQKPLSLGTETLDLATRCAAAYRLAGVKVRRLFNAAVIEKLLVRDGQIAEVRFRAPFDALLLDVLQGREVRIPTCGWPDDGLFEPGGDPAEADWADPGVGWGS